MKAISRAITMTLGTGIFAAVFVSNAMAGCGDLSSLQGPFVYAQPSALLRTAAAAAAPASASYRGSSGQDPSIVGLWSFQFISKGNASQNIPDGVLLDWGFVQYHSDLTELTNSGGVSGGGFCMGVYGQTGMLTYELNHYALAHDPTTGALSQIVHLTEQDTLSPSGDSFTGTLVEDVYDPKGNQLAHVTGTVTATRVTVDTLFTVEPTEP